MVLLSTLAMHPARPRPRDGQHHGPSASPTRRTPTNGLHRHYSNLNNNHSTVMTTPTKDYRHSLSHSQSLDWTSNHLHNYHHHHQAPKNSSPSNNGSDGTGVVSPGVYCSLTNLDEWSPSTVSIGSLLSGHVYSKPTSAQLNRNRGECPFPPQPQLRPQPPHEPTEAEAAPPHPSYPPPSYSFAVHDKSVNQKRALRRSVSCDQSGKDNVYPESRPLGSPRGHSSGFPRVHSEGDLESEYVTLDYSYVPGRGREPVQKPSPHTAASITISSNSATGSPHHHHHSTAQSASLLQRYYSDESNYYYSSNDSSSGYTSNSSSSGNISGPMGPLHRGGSLPTKTALKNRASSAERLFYRSNSSGLCTPPRKKSSQTLQTVAENIVQSLIPVRSSVKPCNSNSNTGSNSGTDTPRSASSSRRSSINSRLGVSNDSSSVTSSDFPLSESRVLVSEPASGVSALNGVPVNPSTTLKPNNDPDSVFRKRLRSKSMSDLSADTTGNDVEGNYLTGCYSDDEDGDDFGFLSYPFTSVSPSPAMLKPKAATLAASPSHRPSLIPRRWRSKTKPTTAPSHPAHPMWSPEGPCTWCSVSGRKVILKPVSILHLTEAERLVLQKIALSKLQAMVELACPIVIPKDGSELRRHKKHALSLKRRSKSANLASLLDTLSPEKGRDKENKESHPNGMVFGIPLARCIANDRELAKRRNKAQTSNLQGRSESADHLLAPRASRKSSSSSQGSLDNGAQNGTMSAANPCLLYESARRAASSDSLSESENSSRNTSSSLIDALSHPVSPGSRSGSQSVGSTAQVPRIVDACLKHLETYGLHVLGIFRVGSSKRRVKQLREEFDSGKDVQLTEEHNPHDVGALLKEFFRDLPEPLLTRDLYLPFVATRKIKDRERQAEVIRLLLTLLPPANRDTLWSLLRFLATVHQYSADTVDSSGQEIPGNKMDSHNLATLFGPNVLHRARAVTEKQFMAECAQQAEESAEVISVTKDMIDNHYELFEISAIQRDEVLRLMMEADQENLDRVLRRLANENQIEPDPESMCSVFDDSEFCPSLPHSANSDADLLSLARRKGDAHASLRVSRSADPWTDPPQRSSSVAVSNPFAEGRRVSSLDNAAERLTDSPSPQDSPQNPLSSRTVASTAPTPRPPLVTVSQESPSPEVVMRSTSGRRRAQECPVSVSGSVLASGRPGVIVRERPFSETYTGSLSIPKPPYIRENSASSASSSYASSSGGYSSQLGSDSSGHWVLPNPDPTPPATSTSTGLRRSVTSVPVTGARRRSAHASSSRSDDEEGGGSPAVDSPEWHRERWRHWELITAGRNGAGDKEQETLV